MVVFLSTMYRAHLQVAKALYDAGNITVAKLVAAGLVCVCRQVPPRTLDARLSKVVVLPLWVWVESERVRILREPSHDN
jgi:hypothetical protein